MARPDRRARRRIDWRWAALAALALAALIAAAAWHLYEPPVTARPALWRISKGDRHAWLFGTIHAVPGGARWLSPAIDMAIQDSDILVLEAADLAAERDERTIFEALGRSPNLPAIAARLSESDRARFAAFKGSAAVPADLDRYESWAAALLIGAAANQGLSQDDGGEARLEALFRAANRPAIGLETIESQLGAFDTLSEADQRILLTQAVTEAGDAPQQFKRLYAHWAAGDLDALQQQFLTPLDRFPRLREALIDRRNAMWTQKIDRLLHKDRKGYFIAVGTGHLLGPGSIQMRLAALGWDVERMQ